MLHSSSAVTFKEDKILIFLPIEIDFHYNLNVLLLE